MSPGLIGTNRRGLAAIGLAMLLAPGCGDDAAAPTETVAPGGIYETVGNIIARSRLDDPDLGALVSGACGAYVVGVGQSGDGFTFDQYIHDLFNTTSGGLDQELVDGSVSEACASFEGDVEAFVESLGVSLGVGIDDLVNFMTTACQEFEQRKETSATDPYAPDPFDPVVGSVFAEGGLDRGDMAALVDAACRDL